MFLSGIKQLTTWQCCHSIQSWIANQPISGNCCQFACHSYSTLPFCGHFFLILSSGNIYTEEYEQNAETDNIFTHKCFYSQNFTIISIVLKQTLA